MANISKMRSALVAVSSVAVLGIVGCSAMASDRSGMQPGAPMSGDMDMPQTVFSDAEMRMHHEMMMASDMNTQRTWARKMIAHHRGAIEMSRILLSSDASDTEVRRMAQAVIDAQTREIAELESWLERHPG